MLDDFTIDSLTEQIGTIFDVVFEGKTIFTLTLEKINIHIQTEQHQNFSLQFRGPLQPSITQGIQTIGHPKFGTSEIFLVPIAKDSDGYLYEAVFNRVQP
ncbi:MAG: hypothetical protein IH585_09520 [Anaerolineaceae bacterium]|nr:hypothetical protein [Anaerolineaceae bacterium]